MSTTLRAAGFLVLGLLYLALAEAGTPMRREQRAAFRSPCTGLVREVAGMGPKQMKALETCMSNLPVIKSLVEQLWKNESADTNAGEEPCEVPPRGRGRQKRPSPLKGCSVTCVLNLLQEGGLDEELISTRRCLAQQAGQLNVNGTFNQTGLNDRLLAASKGKETANNTILAVQSCPPVVNFDVALYFRCVRSYCIKGEPPIDSPMAPTPAVNGTVLPVANSTVANSTVVNSTVGNSTVVNSTVGNSTVGNSTVGNSTVGNSTVGNSTAVNSTVANSTVANSTQTSTG